MIFFFFLIAFIYSSAGFGGGSLYIAALASTGMAVSELKVIALSCNLAVTAISVVSFIRSGWMYWKRVAVLLLFSLPCCIATSFIPLKDQTFLLILAFALAIAAIAMLLKEVFTKQQPEVSSRWWLFPSSSVIGAIAGFTGIGGGVYLAPLLHLSGWGKGKEVAAATSMFIAINSSALLVVQVNQQGVEVFQNVPWYLGAVMIGGWLGSRLTVSLFKHSTIRWVTIGLLIFASARLLWQNW